MATTELKLPKGLSLRGNNSIQAKASVTIDGVERRPTKAFKFVDVKKVPSELTLAEAIAKASEWRSSTIEALTLGKDIKIETRKEYTLEQGVDYTYKQRWIGNKNPDTALTNAKILMKFFGSNVKLKDIDGEAILKFKDHRREVDRVADATINRQLTCLTTICKTCFNDGYFSNDGKVPPKAHLSKEFESRVRYWTKEEEVRFEAECNKRGDTFKIVWDMALISLRAGLRQGEIISLQARDVYDDTSNPDRPVMFITLAPEEVKNNQRRTVSVQGRARQVLLKRMVGLGPTERLFKDITKDALTHRFNTIKGKIGLGYDEQFTFHCCRHTNLTRMSEMGIPPKAIMEWAGHQDLKTTMRYIHPSKHHVQNASTLMAQYDETVVENNSNQLTLVGN